MKNPKPLGKRKCKYCGEEFQKEKRLQYLCLPPKPCSWKYQEKLSKQKIEKNWREEKKAIKEELKTLSDYENDLEGEINAIVRLIDYGQKCISCGNLKRAYAGHFHSVGANKSLRFNLHNEHIQDFNCNGERGGNVVAYGRGLIEWYGKEYKEYVEYDLVRLYPLMKWSKEDLIGWTKKARLIRKGLENDKKGYEAKDRLRLRTELNNRLGIYNNG